jgi:death on curing protein
VKEPAFLTVDEVLALHADQVARHGGRPGIRDLALLESAVAAPKATFGGELLHGTLPEIAAAYLYHLVRNHPFVDGNKRAGLAAAIAFLGLNDLWLEGEEDDVVDLVVAVATGKATKADVAVWLNARVVAFR